MAVLEILIFLVIGFISGFLAGLLGIGGGIIIVPGLLATFYLFHEFIEKSMEFSVATSLACICLAAAYASWLHHRRDAVVWSMVRMVSFGIFFGVIFGVIATHYLPNKLLVKFFGVFAAGMGIYYLFQKEHHQLKTSYNLSQYRFYLGIFIGMLSNLLGIGGGVMAFPLYLHCGLNITQSIGTSSLTTFVTAFLGTIGYMMIGWNSTDLQWTVGYVYLPAFLSITFGIIIMTPIGVRYAHQLSSFHLKKVFGGVLLAIAAWMIFF